MAAMTNERKKAEAEFWRMVRWIAAIGVLMAIGAIVYLAATGELYFHMVVATVLGVFFSVLLGCGLFALSFFSDKSGHDATVRDATTTQGDNPE
jgi:cytochrome c oxidase assembly factor CtaG